MTTTVDLLSLSADDVPLKRMGSTHGGEYAGPCPWCGGTDRFRVWPEPGRYWCRQCGRKGDAIQYLRDRHGLTFQEAQARLGLPSPGRARAGPDLPQVRTPEPENIEPPNSDWQARGWQFVFDSIGHLHSQEGERALAWLYHRGLSYDTIALSGLGYNPADLFEARVVWGLEPAYRQSTIEIDREREKKNTWLTKNIWLPRGVTIPWAISGRLWRINIRRPAGQPKYYQPAGGAVGLYQPQGKTSNRAVVLLEGEFDALTVQQAAGDLVTAVATGSTAGARRLRWLALLAAAPLVLVAFDADKAGEEAANYWITTLSNARRLRPYWEDANGMAQAGVDLRAWVEAGLGESAASASHQEEPA